MLCERLDLDVDPTARVVPAFLELRQHLLDLVDGDDETDALSLRVDGGVDANDVPVQVNDRVAGIAGIDRGIGLYEVVQALGPKSSTSERYFAEMTPTDTDFWRPKGLRTAMTQLPMRMASEPSKGSVAACTATSVFQAVPSTLAPDLLAAVGDAEGDLDAVVAVDHGVDREEESRSFDVKT